MASKSEKKIAEKPAVASKPDEEIKELRLSDNSVSYQTALVFSRILAEKPFLATKAS